MLLCHHPNHPHTHMHTQRWAHLSQGRQAAATFSRQLSLRKSELNICFSKALTQWALRVGLNSTSSIVQSYTEGQKSCSSPILTRCSWSSSPLFPPTQVRKHSSSLVNYSVYLPFTWKKGTSVTSCLTLAQQSWSLFYEGLDPEPGKSLLLLFDSCCPDPTYSFKATLFIQQHPLEFVSGGKFYQCKLGYEIEN